MPWSVIEAIEGTGFRYGLPAYSIGPEILQLPLRLIDSLWRSLWVPAIRLQEYQSLILEM